MKRSLGLAAITMLVLGGCASGPAFQPPILPTDKAVIFIYRPSAFGFAKAYEVKRGDDTIVTMRSHGYYPYVTNPGPVTLSATTETTDTVTLDVQPSQAYYVKAGMKVGVWVNRPTLAVVTADEADADLARCKLLPPGAE
jgi:hypothetical protein